METNTQLIASANTYGGYAIGIISQGACFEVVRMNRHSRYITITRHDDEATARKSANAIYSADMAAMPLTWKRAA